MQFLHHLAIKGHILAESTKSDQADFLDADPRLIQTRIPMRDFHFFAVAVISPWSTNGFLPARLPVVAKFLIMSSISGLF